MSTLRKLTRIAPRTRPNRHAGVHYHGGVTGRVHLCDDPRCTASGRGSARWGT